MKKLAPVESHPLTLRVEVQAEPPKIKGLSQLRENISEFSVFFQMIGTLFSESYFEI